MDLYQPLVTATPWTGTTDSHGAYTPSIDEIYSRAEEIRQQRPRDRDKGPILPTELFKSVIAEALAERRENGKVAPMEAKVL